MNCKEIIIEYLKSNGYSGLFCNEVPCGCDIDDLMPCSMDVEGLSDCVPAYKVKADCKNCKSKCDGEGDSDYCFTIKKPKEQ